MPKDRFSRARGLPSLTTSAPSGHEATYRILTKGYHGAKGQFFPSPENYPLCPPLSPHNMRPLLQFRPKANLLPGQFFPRPESYHLYLHLSPWELRPHHEFLPMAIIESPSLMTAVPSGLEDASQILTKGYSGAKGQLISKLESYPLQQHLSSRDVRPHVISQI